jgi:hypothetical protein
MNMRIVLPLDTPEALSSSSPASSLRRLLAVACRGTAEPIAWQEWLCRDFGVLPQQDVPVAPFSALGDGLTAQTGYWLVATPVTLLLQRDTFSLADYSDTLRMEEAQALIADLNSHFDADGLRFHAAAPERWYVRLERRPQLTTTPLPAVLGRDIQPRLPGGADCLRWHRWLNEIQMLLHAHPVNERREADGLPAINSVWPWGGGEWQPGPARPTLKVLADHPLPRGLAQAHVAEAHGLPAGFAELAGSQNALVILPEPSGVADWQHLEEHWFAPVLAALRAGRIASLEWHLATTSVVSYRLGRRDLWKFWRRPISLESCFG